MNWRWWFRIGINPQRRHSTRYWVDWQGEMVARPEWHRLEREAFTRRALYAFDAVTGGRRSDLAGVPVILDPNAPPGRMYLMNPAMIRVEPTDEDD